MIRQAGVSTIVLVACLAPGMLGAQTFIRGDSNGDGTLNIADSISILNYVYNGGALPTVVDASDVNDNGVVEIADSVYSLLFFFSGGNAPPAPFPMPGVDTTPPNFPAAPNGTLTYRVGTATSCAGAQTLLSIFVDNTDTLEGMNHRVVCDPAEATLVSANDDPLVILLGDQPAFFSVTSLGQGEMVIGTIFDFIAPTANGLGPGVDQRVIDLVVELGAFLPLGQQVPISLEDDPTTTPPTYNLGSVGGEVVLADLVAGSITASCMQEEYLRGDANEDGAVSISDGVFLVQFLFQSGASSSCARTGDTNGDGFLDIGDVVYLLNALFAGGPTIMAPYPVCDLDPFASALGCTSYPATCP